jgi:hypothetical protein
MTKVLPSENLIVPALFLGLGLAGTYALQVSGQNLQKTSAGTAAMADTRKLQVGVMMGAVVAAGLSWWIVTA